MKQIIRINLESYALRLLLNIPFCELRKTISQRSNLLVAPWYTNDQTLGYGAAECFTHQFLSSNLELVVCKTPKNKKVSINDLMGYISKNNYLGLSRDNLFAFPEFGNFNYFINLKNESGATIVAPPNIKNFLIPSATGYYAPALRIQNKIIEYSQIKYCEYIKNVYFVYFRTRALQ